MSKQKPKDRKKIVKGWAFLATERGVPYFIRDSENTAEIYLKKPPMRQNPFNGKMNWKPHEFLIEITYKI